MRRLLAGTVLGMFLGLAVPAAATAYEFRPPWGFAVVDALTDTPVSFDRPMDTGATPIAYMRFDFCRLSGSGGTPECLPSHYLGRPSPPSPPGPPGSGPPPPPPVDMDLDGVSPPADCDDRNSTVRPGAAEFPGNGLDDDCVGGDTPARIHATVSTAFNVNSRGARVTRLRVRDAPSNATVTVRCLGERCRFKPRSVPVGPDGRENLTRIFHRRLRFRTVLIVRVTAPNTIGKVVRYPIRRGAVPRGRTLCLPVGARKPARC